MVRLQILQSPAAVHGHYSWLMKYVAYMTGKFLRGNLVNLPSSCPNADKLCSTEVQIKSDACQWLRNIGKFVTLHLPHSF